MCSLIKKDNAIPLSDTTYFLDCFVACMLDFFEEKIKHTASRKDELSSFKMQYCRRRGITFTEY